MLLTLGLAFNFGLFYYHIKPPKEMHALTKGKQRHTPCRPVPRAGAG